MKLLKTLLFTLLIICCNYANAGFIPMPIATRSSQLSHNNVVEDKMAIAFLITCNIISLLIYIIRSLIWVIKRPSFRYTEYVFFSKGELGFTDVHTLTFIVLNSLALLSLIVLQVYKLI